MYLGAKRRYINTLPFLSFPVNTGVIFDTRVHGPCSWSLTAAREHGPWTRVACTELYRVHFAATSVCCKCL